MASASQDTRGYWRVCYRDEQGKGRTRTFGKGRKAKKEAEMFALEVQYKKAHGEALPCSRAEGIYLDELCQLWVDEKKAQGKGKRWLVEWVAAFNKVFSPPLCKGPAHMVSQADIVAVVGANYADCSQATRNRYMRYLKGVLEFGVAHGHLKANPLSRWRQGKEERRKSRLTLEDLQAIRKAAPEHLAWALEVAWTIPVRPGADLYGLRFDKHVQPARGGVEVYHSKVNRFSFVSLDPAFMRALAVRDKAHKSGHLIEYAGKPVQRLDTSLANAAKKAGLAYPVCMYDLRHLWITTAIDRGIEPSVIAYMAGTSIEMIHRNYYEPHAAERARACEIMPKLREPETIAGRKVVNIATPRS